LAIIILLITLVLPGAVALLWFEKTSALLSKSLLLSYLVFLFNINFAKILGGVTEFYILYFLESVIVVFLMLRFKRKIQKKLLIHQSSYSKASLRTVGIIFVTIVVLTVTIGPYTEIPADVWAHFGKIQRSVYFWERGEILTISPWHTMVGMSLGLTNTNLLDAVPWLHVLLTTIFLAVIFEIACEYWLLSKGQSALTIHFGILVIIAFYIFFGTNVFSYVRYYTFAPTYLAYLIYLFAVGRCYQVIGLPTHLERLHELGWVVLSLIAVYLVHKQEALFIFCVLGTSICVAIPWYLTNHVREKKRLKTLELYVYLILFIGIVVAVVALLSNISSGHPAVEDHIIDLGLVLKILKNVVVADLSGRVFETVGVVGGIVIVCSVGLFIVDKRLFPEHLMLLAAIVTLFNPVFVSAFLDRAHPHLLWRMAYMIPMPFLMVRLIMDPRLMGSRFAVSGLLPYLLLTCFIVADVASNYVGAGRIVNSRWQTIMPVSNRSSETQWTDLIDLLQQYSHRNILTDSVTGYVINGITPNVVLGNKFHETKPFQSLNKEFYTQSSFKDYLGWLIVVNLRDGEASKIGKLSGHWPQDILNVSSQYSDRLIKFLENPPNHIRTIWSRNRITVYEIVD